MKRTLIYCSLFGLTALGYFSACNTSGAKTEANAVITKDSLINRGKYLVLSMGCHDCHSPKKFGPNGPELDPERLLSGHPSNEPLKKFDKAVIKDYALFNFTGTALVGPWGSSYSANITSDATGIGQWSEEQFIKCIRTGKSKGLDNGRPLLPPMPWQSYAQLNDTDLKSIFAYLQTVKPVDNVVPAPKQLSDL